jgi:selenocysteine-specific elongation factor
MRAVVFGTAGHIDHGKTTLVKALTGVDCDRLPEEKRRGITLVLGFAPMTDPAGEVELSFIDVPGHERLVHTMIAGAGGIDRALLVVAADEGVMPQTREHLDVLRLLGVRGGVVALNKSDQLDPELLELQVEELQELLDGGPLAGAPIVPCSATTGAGITELRAAVLACARAVQRSNDPHRPFRLSLDRAFTIAGSGTVVTGTVRWGEVRLGDELQAYPGGRALRVRGLQVHGKARQRAEVGERAAIAVAGAAVGELPRGEQLLAAGEWRTTRRLAIAIELLPSAPTIAEGTRLWIHLLASRVAARVERAYPVELAGGSRGRLILRLGRPVLAFPGDRVVLRSFSPGQTLAGGAVLDSMPPRLRRREAAALEGLPDASRELAEALARWVAEAGQEGATVERLAGRLGTRVAGLESALGRLSEAGALIVMRRQPTVLVHRQVVEEVRARAREVLANAGEIGLPQADFFARVVGTESASVRSFYLADFRRAGLLREVAGRVLSATASPVEDPLASAVEELYRKARWEAPSPPEAAAQLNADRNTVEGLVRFLIEQRRLARVGGKWVIHREALDGVVASIRGWGVEVFDVGQFKDRFGLTRKLAIPVLEWLDSERVTRREGERRRVVRPRTGTLKPD